MWPGEEEQQILLRATGAAPAAQAALQSLTLWSSHRTSRADLMACCHQTIQPRSPSLFLSLPFFSLLFCQLSKLSQSILELKEGQTQCQGGAGHLGPGRDGGYGEHGATSSPFVCGSVLSNSWCRTFNQISLTEVSYVPKFHSAFVLVE